MQTSILTIQSELEKAKEKLKGVEDNIKKSIGRDINSGPLPPRPGFKRNVRHTETTGPEEPPALRPRFQNESVKSRLGDFVRTADEEARNRGQDFRGRTSSRRVQVNVEIKSRGRKTEKSGEERVSAKKRLGDPAPAVTVFSRLSGPPKEDDFEEKALPIKITSQVIVQDAPSRKEILAAQNGDYQSKARNRRIFGALLGTLQKFRQEENQLKEKEEKRALVEKKLEEAALREKEELKKKRQELFSMRRQQQAEIRQLEYKLIRLRQLLEWESTKKHLLNFIQTKSSPKLFYIPKIHNDKSKELLEESQRTIQRMIEKKRKEVEKAIVDHAEARKIKDDEDGDGDENHEDLEEIGGEEETDNLNGEDKGVSRENNIEDNTVGEKVIVKLEKDVKQEVNGLDKEKENESNKENRNESPIRNAKKTVDDGDAEEIKRRKRHRHGSSSNSSNTDSSEDEIETQASSEDEVRIKQEKDT